MELDIFTEELAYIKDEGLREFTKFLLSKLPPNVWQAASSSSGKYHSEGETIEKHTRAVVYFGKENCDKFNLNDTASDIVISACILHDGLKRGVMVGKWTTKTHAEDMARFAEIITKGKFEGVPKELIFSCIRKHSGRWANSETLSYPEDFTTLEQAVHDADFSASRREVHLKFLNEADNLIG